MRNIVKQAEKEKFLKEKNILSEELLVETAEKELWKLLNETIKKKVGGALKEADYEEVLKTLVRLQKNINDFFDDVKVMAEDETLRNNRLILLKNVVELFLKVADFSKIVIEGGK